MNSRLLALRTMPYGEYLKTPEWKEKRDMALKRDGYRCRACNSSEDLNVHHRTYEQRGNEDLNDLTTFCQSCHEHFHRKMSQMEIMERTHPEVIHDEATRKKRQSQKLEDYLIGMLIQNPSLLPYVCGILSESDFVGSDTLALYRLLSSVSLDYPFEQSVPSDLLPVISRTVKESMKPEPVIDREKQVKIVIDAATRIKRIQLLRSFEELKALSNEAASANDRVTAYKLLQQMTEIRKLIALLG
jgi:hypothetical protein